MAVIVRGGRRPPERKWELYKQFYDVIRTREANRNLPDRHLASLLREDASLLKTVHNHLGFCLHALAETAGGAHASLPRSAFQNLVENIVQEKKDGDTRTTVDTVMTAATDRLVLINTPDDGQKVRFDIRQLQEFFAAEFLYDGIASDELRNRLETIAGDAHWREVLHFLISALVEHNRRTDLSVAVSVLQEIDEGGGREEERTLSRILANGALIAARLLGDGVLEHDKGIRNLFRDRLMPIATTRQPEVVEPLIHTKTTASANWLLDFMLQHVKTTIPSESTGACILLLTMLTDEDPRTKVFIDRWRTFPIEHQMGLLSSTFELLDKDEKDRKISNWFLQLTVELLASESALSHGRALIAYVRRNCRIGFLEAPLTKAITSTLGQESTDLFRKFLNYSSPHAQRELKTYGWAHQETYQLHRVTDPASIALAAEVKTQRTPLHGYFKLLGSILLWTTSYDRESYVALLKTLNNSWSTLYILPLVIRRSIPTPANSELSPVEILAAITDQSAEDFESNLAAGKIGTYQATDQTRVTEAYSTPVPAPNASTESFLALSHDYPDIALRIWVDRSNLSPHDQKKLEHPTITAAIGNLVATKTSLLLDHPLPLYWGELLKAAKPHEQEVRQKLCILCQDCSAEPWSILGEPGKSKISPLLLTLPQDAVMLPLITGSVISHLASNPFGRVHNPERTKSDLDFSSQERAQMCSRIIPRYVPNIEDLGSIINDDSQKIEIRGAAALLGMLHPHGGLGYATFSKPLLLQSAASDSALGLLFAFCVDILEVDSEPAARALISSILDASPRKSFSAFWSTILTRWRERSRAPATRLGAHQKWLHESNT